MTASLSGPDAVVFGGGVGFGAVPEGAAAALTVLGLRPDQARSPTGSEDRRVEAAGSRRAVLAVETWEEVEIARRTRQRPGGSA